MTPPITKYLSKLISYNVFSDSLVQAEKVAARMIAEKRMVGSIDQIDRVIYLKSELIHSNSFPYHSHTPPPTTHTLLPLPLTHSSPYHSHTPPPTTHTLLPLPLTHSSPYHSHTPPPTTHTRCLALHSLHSSPDVICITYIS